MFHEILGCSYHVELICFYTTERSDGVDVGFDVGGRRGGENTD